MVETEDVVENFSVMNAEFDMTLKELKSRGPALGQFRMEYEKLYRALRKSHESEERLQKRNRELTGEIKETQDKVQQSKLEEEEIQLAKRRLQEDIDKAWKSVEESQQREKEKKQQVQDLDAAIERLKAQLAAGSGWSPDQERMLAGLQKQRESLNRDLESKTTALNNQRDEVARYAAVVQEEENGRLELEQEIAAIGEATAKIRSESEREQKRKDRFDRDLKSLKVGVEAKMAELGGKRGRIREGQEEIAALEGQLTGARGQMERYLKEYDSLFQRTHALTEELDEQMRGNQMLTKELHRREAEVAEKRSEIVAAKKAVARAQRLKEHTLKRIARVDAEREGVDKSRQKVKDRVAALSTSLGSERRTSESLRKSIDDLLREREILNKSLVKADDKTRRTVDLVKIHENTGKNLGNEIQGYMSHARRQREMIEQLDLDVVRYDQEASSANQKYYTALEEVKLQELQIAELQKKIVEGETKLKQQQNLYEAVRSDRNLYSKNLMESQEEIAEMKRKFKIMNHQIEQLKEEITAKDHALVKEHFDHHKVEKEKEALKNELAKIRKHIQSSEQIIANQAAEIHKLAHIITEADEERVRQGKELEAVVSERDILGSQLIRRNEELSTLYEKIKINKSTLAKGSDTYSRRRREKREAENNIRRLTRELAEDKARVSSKDDLRNEVYRLQRELLAERTKITALSEELERPLNVHRWRNLEGSDPARFQTIRKMQTLQRRLIAKTEEVVEKDLLIAEKEKLYVELKNILARQPGPEVAEQLAVYASNLKEKSRQMRAMGSELEMYKAQVGEYKYELERLSSQHRELGQRYLQRMRRQRGLATPGGGGGGGGDGEGDGQGHASPAMMGGMEDSQQQEQYQGEFAGGDGSADQDGDGTNNA